MFEHRSVDYLSRVDYAYSAVSVGEHAPLSMPKPQIAMLSITLDTVIAPSGQAWHDVRDSLRTTRSSAGRVREAYRCPTRRRAASGDRAHRATLIQLSAPGAERLVAASPGGDTATHPPDEL